MRKTRGPEGSVLIWLVERKVSRRDASIAHVIAILHPFRKDQTCLRSCHNLWSNIKKGFVKSFVLRE